MPTKELPRFPTRAERLALVNQLQNAREKGTALTNLAHFQNYLHQLQQLNQMMDRYSEIDPQFGLPPELDEAGKLALLNAMQETAVAGERFLADVQSRNASLSSGVPLAVSQLQGMLAQDFDTLRLYNRERNPMSFPELQQLARTQVVDLRGKQIGVMTNKLSARIPMTVVDLQGNRRPGVFTKASYVDIKSKFQAMLQKAAALYDDPAFRSTLWVYKESLFKDKVFPEAASVDEISDQQVIDVMKGRVLNMAENYRAILIQRGERINGKDPRTAPTEQLILGLRDLFIQSIQLRIELSTANSHLVVLRNRAGDPAELVRAQERVDDLTQKQDKLNNNLHALGLDLDRLPEEVSDALNEGFKNSVGDLTNLVNVRDLDLTEGQRYDHRNSAMSAVAGLMGMNQMIARSENMKFLDEDGNEVEGTFMEFADGLDIHGKDGLREFNKVADDPFAPPCKALPKIADLQAFDYLCGNVDRHGGNMSYKVDENGKFIDIVAFDNDTSFGTVPIDPKKGRFRQAGLQDLMVISKPMSQKLLGLTPEMLKFSLRGRGLSEPEIQASCDRLEELKGAIRKGIQAKRIDDIKNAKGRLCIMETADLEKVHIDDIPDTTYALFHNVRVQLFNQMHKARKAGYAFEPGALAREGQSRKPQLTEVSTTERKYAAAGIADSMGDMERMIENQVTGFRVKGLSKFLHSSGNWRDMIKAVKNASKTANALRKSIGPDKEGLHREDPKVRKELERADAAMEKARAATEAYLRKKMREKGVDSPEALVGRGKHAYEQNRIDYALKLRQSLQAYDRLKAPAKEQGAAAQAQDPAWEQGEAARQLLDFANKRKARQPQRQAGM